ncbi:MAG: chromate transporter [Oscillospiraceae bacterium]|nr:chromate transporter [Oscillospiraceae bacterium]
MTLLRLFFEFAKVGLFAVGGGLATIPFLQDIGARTSWFTDTDLTTMIAVSESTPGPMGVNMATYVGFETAGLPGAVLATLGLITPSIIVIIIIAGFLQKFRQSKTVDAVFSGLRPASTALIASAGLSVAVAVFLSIGGVEEHTFSIHWPAVVLAVAVFLCMQNKKLKKLHPIVFIALAAVAGAVFQF